MSSSKRDICISLIKRKYGQEGGDLINFLLSKSSGTIEEMKKSLKMEKMKLRQLLIIFFKNGYIELSKDTNSFKINQFRILEESRKLLYLNFLKIRHGETASYLAETLLLNSLMTFEELIANTQQMSKISKKLKTK